MSATVKPQYVYDLISNKKIVFFTVKSPDKGMTYGENQDNISTGEAIDELSRILNGIQGRTVLVELRPKPRAKKAGEGLSGGDMKTNFFDLYVDISDNLPKDARGYQGNSNSINGLDEILKREATIHTLQLDKLRAELSEQAKSPLIIIAEKFASNDKLISAVSDRLLNALLPPPPPPKLAGAAAPSNLTEVLKRLEKIDSDYIETLTNLVNYIEQYPGMIDQVKTMITPK